MLETLKWKFDYYDRNGNYKLTPGEQFLCKKEIESFMHCSSFFDHFIEMVDANSDEEIIFSEWSSFFEGKCYVSKQVSLQTLYKIILVMNNTIFFAYFQMTPLLMLWTVEVQPLPLITHPSL